MIITKKWLEELINISEISSEEICKALNSIGLEVDSEKKIFIAPKVVVGKVIEKVKHPNADKLNICQVDLGNEITQIVCGAKNVDVDQYVPVACVGCCLGENFTIKKAKLRGEPSNGMICSATELGLPKVNDGILVLDDSIGELILGKELREYDLLNDTIIEIELTANRGDCLSINGIARELSSYFNTPFYNFEEKINSCDKGVGQILEINFKDNIDANLSYKIINLKNYTVPVLQKIRLSIIGKLLENNKIQNTLNYFSHFTGVILNAYEKPELEDDQRVVLDIQKDKNNFNCVFYKDTLLSKIGVNHKDCADNSDLFLLEASYTNPVTLSKKVFEAKEKTGDVFYNTSRGSEPDLALGFNKITTFISCNGGTIAKGEQTFENYLEKKVLNININKINAIIGEKIDNLKIEKILTSLGFEMSEIANEVFTVRIPLYRHDIENIADIAEEITRMIGIDNIKAKPLLMTEKSRINQTSIDLEKRNKIRYKAIANGFYETLTYVFTSRDILEKYNFKTIKEELDIVNPIAKELNTLRTSLLPNLVEACSNNYKNGSKSTAFFEIGTIFNEAREESKKIAFIQTGAKEEENIENSGKPEVIDFYSFAKKVLNSIGKFELETNTIVDNDFIHPYQSANILIDGKICGIISKLHPSICKDYDLEDTFYAEIDFNAIKNDLIKAETYSKFQSSKKDLSILVPKDLNYKEIRKAINSLNNECIKQFNLIDIYNDESLKDKDSLTIRFVLQSNEKTFEEEDFTNIMNSILKVLKDKLSIDIR